MKQLLFLVAVLIHISVVVTAVKGASPRNVDVKSADGTILKASYFASAKPAPGVLLFHQSNRTRKSWDDVGAKLAAAGINTLTVDMRGHGETGGKYDNWNDPNREQAKQQWQADIDAAFQYLISQSGVNRDVIGLGGAGVLGGGQFSPDSSPTSGPDQIARAALGRDLPRRSGVSPTSIGVARVVRRLGKRRVPADTSGDGIALRHGIESEQKIRPLF